MKTLSTGAAATALGIDIKAFDNILAREGRALLRAGARGKRRKIPVPVLEQVAVALVLNRDLGAGIAKALEIAAKIVSSPTAPVAVGTLCGVSFDIEKLRAALDSAIGDALESVAEPTRGRPIP